jgi:hypothetical protein
VPKQFQESFARNRNHIESSGCAKSCIPRLLGEECSFSKNLAISESNQSGTVAFYRHFAFDNKVHFVTGVTVAKDRLPLFKMFAVHIFIVKEP